MAVATESLRWGDDSWEGRPGPGWPGRVYRCELGLCRWRRRRGQVVTVNGSGGVKSKLIVPDYIHYSLTYWHWSLGEICCANPTAPTLVHSALFHSNGSVCLHSVSESHFFSCLHAPLVLLTQWDHTDSVYFPPRQPSRKQSGRGLHSWVMMIDSSLESFTCVNNLSSGPYSPAPIPFSSI